MSPPALPRWLKWTLLATAGLAVLAIAAVLGTAALVDAGYFHEPVLRLLAAKTHRQIRVNGPAQTHFLSWHPRLVAERVVIGSPPWMPGPPLAQIGKVSAEFDLPGLSPRLTIRRLTMDSVTLRLARDVDGNANWRARPGKFPGDGPPLIHSLRVRNAHVVLDDARRHLQFDGRVSAAGAGKNNDGALAIQGKGQLNGRPVNFAASGDPLATARRDKAYRFSFEEHSSGSHLGGRGVIARPFNFRELTTTFVATGADIKDLYFLTGLTFPDTGAYRVTGRLKRSGMHFTFSDIAASSGQSDMRGTVKVDSSGARSKVTATVESKLLRVADFGKSAAQRKPEAAEKQDLLLSDTPLRLTAIRRTDSRFDFNVTTLDLGPLQMSEVKARLAVDRGAFTAGPLSASYPEGKLTGELRLDASREVPRAQIDIQFDGLQLEHVHSRDSKRAPFEGPLNGRIALSGQGRSPHQIAASAEGSIAVVLPHGRIRASLAELAGLDLRSLGLKLTPGEEMTELRCAVARFDVRDGAIHTRDVVLDTAPVVVTGEGSIDLTTEAIDMTFRGEPKRPRLRLRSPVHVRGTLADPSFGIEAKSSVAQVSASVALGLLLTPFAAIAAFVDPGRGKDADCAALTSAPL